ncbi:Nucleotidylyl transferase [Trichocladium antarcticum]|uniref:Nucleotidylyl transferase n=1 Tax=Trichocladium antarcticum TaxID=1450529 RepID=A0AAN6Z9X8_9PEZI|nr:Nucleotidylyl transferase [Trichocladium antarcticum]
MSLPGKPSVAEHPMPSQLPTSARSLVAFFSRALLSFQSSNSKLSVICTAPPPHRDGVDHGQPEPVPPQSRPRTLIVLDSSFNPPTRAHLRLATSAIHDLAHEKGQRLGALRLLLLLSVNNADKAAKPAAFDKRLAMMWAFVRDLRRGLQDEPGLALEDTHGEALGVDLGLSTLPYFHDKSTALADSGFYSGYESGEGVGHTEQVFLVGYDTLLRIFNPKYYGPAESATQLDSAEASPMQNALGPFFNRARLRVTMRPGDEWGDADEQTAYLGNLLRAEGLSRAGGHKDWASRIEMVEGPKAEADIISSTHARAAARDRDLDKLGLMVTPEVKWWIEQGELYTE